MNAETDFEPRSADPGSPQFADRDFAEGVVMDDAQPWIGEVLAERLERIDAGEMKMLPLEEFEERLEALRREKNHSR